MYKAIKRINRDRDKETIKKKSNIIFDKGTIIIIKIATNIATTIKSFDRNLFKFIYVIY